MALAKIVNDLLIAKSAGQFSVLFSLDVSAPFDSVDCFCLPETLLSLSFHDTMFS